MLAYILPSRSCPIQATYFLKVPRNLTARLRRVDRHINYTSFSNIVKLTLVAKVRDVLLPLGMFVEAVIHYVVANYGRRRWLTAEFHASHFGRAPCFALVTGLAGAHHVLPGMFASEVARDDVVYGEVSGLFAAVLAGVIVSKKHLAPAHLPLRAGALDEVDQAYYRGQGHGQGRTADIAGVFFQHLSLAPPYQDNRPPRSTDIERLVVLIEDQDRGIDHNNLRIWQILAGNQGGCNPSLLFASKLVK